MIAVFDSSSLISMGQSCLIGALKALKEQNNSTFVVPETVFFEVVQNPLRIKRFQLNAVRVKKAIQDGWLEVKTLDSNYASMAGEIEGYANNLVSINGNPIKVIQRGEIEALALTKQLGSNVLVIDERTTRTIIENPAGLKELIERRQQRKVQLNYKNAESIKKMFSGLNIVRSAELIALAFERKLIDSTVPTDKQALEAALYAVKFAGCAISGNEIENFLKGVKREN